MEINFNFKYVFYTNKKKIPQKQNVRYPLLQPYFPQLSYSQFTGYHEMNTKISPNNPEEPLNFLFSKSAWIDTSLKMSGSATALRAGLAQSQAATLPSI